MAAQGRRHVLREDTVDRVRAGERLIRGVAGGQWRSASQTGEVREVVIVVEEPGLGAGMRVGDSASRHEQSNDRERDEEARTHAARTANDSHRRRHGDDTVLHRRWRCNTSPAADETHGARRVDGLRLSPDCTGN